MGVGHAVLDVGGPGHEGWRGQGPAFEDVGNSLAGNIASQVQQRANAIIAQNTAILQSDLQNQITQGVTTRVLENWASAPHSVSDFLSDKELSNVFRDDEALTANWTPGLQQFCRVCPPAGWRPHCKTGPVISELQRSQHFGHARQPRWRQFAAGEVGLGNCSCWAFCSRSTDCEW
jgi:hypothetical protein